MKAAAALLLLLLLAVPARAVSAQIHGTRVTVSADSDDDSPGRLGQRRDPRGARSAIATRDGKVALLLTRDEVVMQLTDRALRDIRREMAEDMDEDDDGEEGFLEGIVQAAVRRSVSSMLNRSVEYPVSDLRDVQYRGGRLLFTTRDGERVFENVNVNDTDVMESFSEADARAFVREFQRLKASRR
ncbi:MAG TPA: hypothetical protein VF615_16875 [Longimicrobiaceae bacterium]|jgi:hypothetical protein